MRQLVVSKGSMSQLSVSKGSMSQLSVSKAGASDAFHVVRHLVQGRPQHDALGLLLCEALLQLRIASQQLLLGDVAVGGSVRECVCWGGREGGR